MKNRPRSLLAILVLAAWLSAATAPSALPQDDHLETFERAWTIIYETHWDPDFNGVDWLAVREELRPRAAAAETAAELREIINEMIARLDQSHFALLPRGALLAVRGDDDDPEAEGGRGDAGFETVIIDGRFVVARVDPDLPAYAAGVRPGWILDSVGGRSFGVGELEDDGLEAVDAHKVRVEAQRSMDLRLSGEPGSSFEAEFLDGDDQRRSISIRRAPPRGEVIRFGNLPPVYARLDRQVIEPDVGMQVGHISFNIWLPILSRPFDEAVDAVREMDGVILDLRGNPGGLGGMVMGMGGHFVEQDVSLGTMRTRDSELEFRPNPRRIDTRGERVEPFAGPLAILIDNTSASTSEVFAAGMQAIGRGRVFGQRSMGAVLPSLMDELPNGDVLQHAFADFVVSGTGVRLEGRGVIPDEEVRVSRADLLAGRDPVLDAAVEWIVRTTR